MTIDALKIWDELQSSKLCVNAVKFYQSNGILRNNVLSRGAADFDALATNNENEKPLYRAAAYIAKDYSRGYDGNMNMHIKQNLKAFSHYLKKTDKNKKILFVDFGCGPLTAGLALAENLSRKTSNYRKNVFYLGVDRSKSMIKLAKKINRKYQIFDDELFRTQHDFRLNVPSMDFEPDLAILNLSYVLAPQTFRSSGHEKMPLVTKIAKTWNSAFSDMENCNTTGIIYHNPIGDFHGLWKNFGNKLTKFGKNNGINYDVKKIKHCEWGGSKPSAMAMIKGTKKAKS